jgi:GDP-D-mannose dehydratase
MNSLVIGNTSQLSFYFPDSFEKISSRDIDFKKIKTKFYDRIYVTFADQRTFLTQNENNFNNVNKDLVVQVIDELKNFCNKIVIFSTSELWNGYNGKVDLSAPYLYNYSPYIKSKELLCNYINNHRDLYNNVIIVYPFNFNSIYRKEGFLFYKIFDSIINKNKNNVGNIDFNRDILHPLHIVRESIRTDKDLIVGSGFLTNVKKFVQDLFLVNNLDINSLLELDAQGNFNYKRNEYYSSETITNYEEILNFTNYDIQKNIISRGYN